MGGTRSPEMRGLNKAGARVSLTNHLTHLAEAEALDGLFSDAFTTTEVDFKANLQDVLYRPNVLTLLVTFGRNEAAPNWLMQISEKP